MASETQDVQLLALYVRQRDEAAFGTIVRRYADMVYSAALRRVGGDSHLAEDITQAVFIILARKAASIRDDRAVAPWLLQTTGFAAQNALRARKRDRRVREALIARAAANPDLMNGSANSPSDALIWQDASHRLDDAVLKLPVLDRRAIVLRYFQGKPLAEIALDLNTTEAAAQRRIGRAVEKLRERLSRFGRLLPALDVAVLATLLDSHAITSAPPRLASDAAFAAFNQNTTMGAGFPIAKGAMAMMIWQKVKIVTTTMGLVVLGAGGLMTLSSALAEDKAPTAGSRTLAPARRGNPGARPGTLVPVAAPQPPITSVADAAPAIVSTTPPAGATDVDPALTEIRITFSKEVDTARFEALGTVDKERFPTTTAAASASAEDKHIWTLPVKLEAGKTYVIPVFNATGSEKRRSFPYVLVFETKR
jgi:RNA polymerase sigma factor (sigma-70 family)